MSIAIGRSAIQGKTGSGQAARNMIELERRRPRPLFWHVLRARTSAIPEAHFSSQVQEFQHVLIVNLLRLRVGQW